MYPGKSLSRMQPQIGTKECNTYSMAIKTDNKQPVVPVFKQPAPPPAKCLVTEQPDGCFQILTLVDADVARRIKRKANGMDIERYIYENILKRAFEGHVY